MASVLFKKIIEDLMSDCFGSYGQIVIENHIKEDFNWNMPEVGKEDCRKYLFNGIKAMFEEGRGFGNSVYNFMYTNGFEGVEEYTVTEADRVYFDKLFDNLYQQVWNDYFDEKLTLLSEQYPILGVVSGNIDNLEEKVSFLINAICEYGNIEAEREHFCSKYNCKVIIFENDYYF